MSSPDAKSLIPCVQKDDALLADFRRDVPVGTMSVWWLGQSGFLLKTANDVHVLFDPYLSDSLTEKYAGTDQPHVRMTERPIDPARLDMIDVVTSSHNHTDHFDAKTLVPILRANREHPGPQLVLPNANIPFARKRLGSEEISMSGQSDREGGELAGTRTHIWVHGITAAHNQVERNEDGDPKAMGFVFAFREGGCVYHSGDTLMHEGLVEQLEAFDIDLALLPINGNRPARRVAGNLFGDEAAKLAKAIGARLAVPCHYDMFTFNTESPDLFMRTCEEIGQPYRILRCGERLDVVTNK